MNERERLAEEASAARLELAGFERRSIVQQMSMPLQGTYGIRTGMDVFKALALGADAVLIARPFVTMVYGGGQEGVQAYVDKLQAELADTMAMCGAHSLADIDRSMLFGF